MKISTDWLRDFVELKPPIADHAAALTEAGLEVEGMEKLTSGDTVFQVEVTTNRPDWLSHLGVARELAAIHGLTLIHPKVVDENKISRVPPPSWKINIKDVEACPHYTGVLIEGITEQKTPDFIRKRLESCGLRAIHLIVDITNYVLLELGQPMHAFDADTLTGKQIVVRRARKNEKLQLISGVSIELAEGDLVVADTDKALALAGIIGGKESEITDRSRNIFLETAHFQPRIVRNSARRHQLNTDSSYRFERRVDPSLVNLARLRALALIQEYAKPRHISGVICAGQKPDAVIETLQISEEFVNATLGSEIKPNQISSILTRLGLDVKPISSKAWKVSIPSFRADLSRPIDLVEEIARIYGFNHIAEALPKLHPGVISTRPERKIQKLMRDFLVGAGFHEAVTFSLISSQGYSDEDMSKMVRLRNPLQAGLEWMRPSLLPSLLPAISRNLRYGNQNIALFELAHVYSLHSAKDVRENNSICFTLCGQMQSHSWLDAARDASYFDLKGQTENILKQLGIENIIFEKSTYPGLSESVSEKILADKKEVGYAGQVSSDWLKLWDIPKDVFYVELQIDRLCEVFKINRNYTEIIKYPAMERDLSMMIPEKVHCGQVIEDIRKEGGELVQDVQLLDLFQGGRIPKGHKNFTFRITYLSLSRTLTAEEIDLRQSQIAQKLAIGYQAQFQSS